MCILCIFTIFALVFNYIGKIPTEKWTTYIVSHFADRNRVISDDLAAGICAAVDNHSSYVQQLSWLIFSLIDEGERVEERHLAMGVDSLLNSQEQLFMQQIEPLTAYQMNFLRCIIAGHHENFGDAEIRETFDLGSVSNITRLKTALVERDLVEIEGRKFNITDPVFALWFKRSA